MFDELYLTGVLDVDDDYEEWVTEQPMGDRLCACPCGCQRELMPEESDLCSACLAGDHEGPNALEARARNVSRK